MYFLLFLLDGDSSFLFSNSIEHLYIVILRNSFTK